MDDPLLADGLDRAERALERIERALANGAADRANADPTNDSALRDKVRGVVAELDELIRAAGGR